MQKFSLDSMKFLQMFKNSQNLGIGKEYDPLKAAFAGSLAPDRQKTFDVFRRVMMAKSTKDLDGLTVEDLMDCWISKADFEGIFERKGADFYLDPAQKNFENYRTLRKRRVL